VARILIAEDDPRIAATISDGLRANGFTTHIAYSGDKAESLSLTEQFDLLILDMGLPRQDGFHVLQELRARGRTMPVIVLTGRPERDVVMCLEAGADDYMRKPFRTAELLERVRARLRAPHKRPTIRNVLTAGGIALDVMSRRAMIGDRTVELSGREFAMLETLLRHPGQILSRSQLSSSVWGQAHDPSSNYVEVGIAILRKKLGVDAVETVRGAGYRLRIG
jgi:DNA-binding response OmpR family regulator